MNTNNNTNSETTEKSTEKRRGRRKGGPKSLGKQRGRRGRSNGGPRRSGRKRPLAHGDLRLLILKIVEAKPSHGYGLIAEIKSLTSGFYEPSPGVIYPALEALQDLEWVEIQAEKGKRVLHITATGKAELARQSGEIKSIEERLAKLSSPEQEIEADDIRGALRLLKHTTVSNFKGKNVNVKIRKQAVTILEDARKKIGELG